MFKSSMKFRYGTAILLAAMVLSAPLSVQAEDCTGLLPDMDCTLDEDTNAALTIDAGVTLTVGGSVLIGHEIDADDVAGDGMIGTTGIGNNITQSADIGGNLAIDELSISDDNTWTTSAAINTDNTGSDINLGAGDGGETLNFIAGGSFLGEIDGNAADIVNFGSDGNGGNFITGGQIESVTLIVTSGNFFANNTLGGGIGLGAVNIADGATVTQGANITTDGALDLDGTLRIGAGNRFTADTYNADADSGTIILEVSRSAGTTTSGEFSVLNGGPLDLTNDTVQISVGANSQRLVSETIDDVIRGNGGPTMGPGEFVDNSFLYDFSLVPSGNNFDLMIVAKTTDEAANTANNLVVANLILNRLRNVDVADINELQSILGNAPTQEEFNEILESVQPTVDGGHIQASFEAKNQMVRMTSTRVNTLFSPRRTEPKTETVAYFNNPEKSKRFISGSKNLKTGRVIDSNNTTHEVERKPYVPYKSAGSLWAQPYIGRTDQSAKDDIDGFETDTTGIVVGADTGNMRDDRLLGMAIVAANNEVVSENSNSTRNEITSFGASVYGGTLLKANTLLSGSLSYINNKSNISRYDLAGITGNNAYGDYTLQHVGFNTTLARQYKTDGSLTITPKAMFDYDYLETDTYDEFGKSSLAMTVDYDEVKMGALGLGVDLNSYHELESGININTASYLAYKYDFINSGVGVKANYSAAPSLTFQTEGFEPQRHIVNLGGAVEAEVAEDWKLALGYDVEYKEEALSHGGRASVVHNF